MPGKNRNVQAARYAMVPRQDVPRSAFDQYPCHKTTFSSGVLVPVFVDEVLPGDTISVQMDAFVRVATLVVPVMDNLYLESFFFFIPNRLVWANWERFMGEKVAPTDTTTFVTPKIAVTNAAMTPGSIYDYFGLTTNGVAGTLTVQAMPFRCYNLVYNEFFRDQDLVDPVAVPTDDGPDGFIYGLLRRGKRHDYFTSARPWPEKPMNVQSSPFSGESAIPGGRMTYPQAGAPVSGIGIGGPPFTQAGLSGQVRETGGRTVAYTNQYPGAQATPPVLQIRAKDDFPDVRVLINDIRTASVVQHLLEINARGGTRYAELVRAHWGVVSPDARLQRPEFLGGGRSFVQVSPIAQTSGSGATGTSTVLGELGGIGTVRVERHGFSQSFTEHGWILGLVNVRADLTYQNGLARFWKRSTQFDHYWPSLEGLGEQAIMQSEIFSDGSAGDNLVFGYQERWSEYKWKPSRISGWFRSTVTTPLDMWHYAQNFAAAPQLNSTFILENPPLARALQVNTLENQEFIGDFLFSSRYVRAMRMYSLPGVGPRF